MGRPTGEYYYAIEAHNDYGDELSNCEKVTIQIPPPGPFNLSSTADDPDPDGTFNLNWEVSTGAHNYSVYYYTSYITDINGTVTLLESGMTLNTKLITGYGDGFHYFVVVAINADGNCSSNCLEVIVGDPPGLFILSSDATNPDTDGSFNLNWDPSLGAVKYSIYVSTKVITTIDDNCTLISSDLIDITFPISGLSTGDYYYVVMAYSLYGETMSNCIHVKVEIPGNPNGGGIVGYDVIIMLSAAIGISMYYINTKKKKT